MTQDDSPASAGIGEEKPTPVNVPASPTIPADSTPNRKPEACVPDPFAVGVRVLKMAPAWLLAITVGCSTLILLLGWMNAGGAATAVAQPFAPNDARASRAVPAANAAKTAALAHPPESTPPAKPPADAAPAPVNSPAPATAQATAPAAPPPQAAQQSAPDAPAAPPQAAEKAQAESPARGDDSAAKFTVQVGSFNNPSEANERVSGLRGAGFDARTVAAELPGRGTWYRVQVGRFAGRDEAAKAVANLRAKGAAANAIVVPL